MINEIEARTRLETALEDLKSAINNRDKILTEAIILAYVSESADYVGILSRNELRELNSRYREIINRN